MKPIYLDYNATTPLDPAVVAAMLPYLQEHFGNPSSAHVFGTTAHAAVEHARQQVADLLGAEPDEIIFTSGGTEASNHAIKGTVFAQLHPYPSSVAEPNQGHRQAELSEGRGGGWARDIHVITSAVEHPATLQPCEFLKRLGCRVTIVPVDRHGCVDPDDVRRALDRRTKLVSIMHANNEVGTLQPIRAIADLAHEHGALMHTDAAQSVGKLPVDVNALRADLLSLAGHKLYAPKGVGALYVRRGVQLEPLLHGAGHESGRRAGTENVPYLVGLGTTCAIARSSLPEATERLRRLRERLWERLQSRLGDGVVLNGHPDKCLPNTLNVNFRGHVAADLLQAVPEIAASTGSACHEGSARLSPVLEAMGVPPELGRGAVRLSVGRFTTTEDIDRAAEALIAVTKNGHSSGKADSAAGL